MRGRLYSKKGDFLF